MTDKESTSSIHKALQIPLPTLPTIAIRLLKLFDDPNVELPEVVGLLRSDPAIVAKIIMAVNSSAYGVGREVTDLQQAIALLGKTVITSLALSFSLSEKSMTGGADAKLYRSYWLQSMTQAVTAEYLARRYAKQQTGEWFLTGLLASIGRLSLINHDPQLYANVISHSKTLRIPLHDAEASLFGTSAVDLSVELLTVWNLPHRCVCAVANQSKAFRDVEVVHTSKSKQFEAAISISMSVGEYFCQSCQGQSLVHIVHLMEEAFDASEDDVDRMIDSVRNRLDATSDLFQVDCTSLGSPAELMSLAMQHLTSMAVGRSFPDPANESITRLAQQNERLLERVQRLTLRSTTDSLTGLFNRGYFEDRFQEQIAESEKAQIHIGLIIVDIDHFKEINDTFGHLAGDDILRQVATVIHQSVRSSDVVARYGGEEFVVLVPESDLDVLSMLSERIRDEIEAASFFVESERVPVTTSVGAAFGSPTRPTQSFCKSLIATADRALYESKRKGRNRICVAPPLDCEQIPISASC